MPLSLLMFVYFIVADIWIPLTPDSTVMRVVTPVSPRVSGYVAAVHVHNNSQVKKGDLLFELDDTPFRNKVEAAQIALEQARLVQRTAGCADRRRAGQPENRRADRA
ncbi:secretion protein HlyD family protein [Enterobacter asburiae]|uniref:Secretion protein HlyD family protein n=1 Tax=Enterobacter asburiae TaxID=61645 RepID=A0A376FJU5_ENTAS|nr:secretion protein HlyD family protein [Enterobacter asburiae]